MKLINLWQNDLILDWFKDTANFIKIHDKKANESFMDKELEF